MTNILDFTLNELKDQFKKSGLESYRAAQIFDWIYAKGVYDFDQMTNLSLAFREKIKTDYRIVLPEIVETQSSGGDSSTKLLMKLEGGDLVEAVTMPFEGRKTVCVSSQVGCKFKCVFCASGMKGFYRNLTVAEIIGQVLRGRDRSDDKKITHVVFMGIGEPLDNYETVLKTIRLINSDETFNIGARRITISTCGVIPKIQQLDKEDLQVELSVSLHAPNDEIRNKIMPVNQAYPVKPLIEACRHYASKTKRAITFEVVLIKGLNASEKEAQEMVRLLKGLLCKVNLIPYNLVEEFPQKAPSYEEILRFQKILQQAGITTTVRFSKGQDIRAACGQLRAGFGTVSLCPKPFLTE